MPQIVEHQLGRKTFADKAVRLTRAERAAERWLPINGYEQRYEVSDMGRVRVVQDRKGGVWRHLSNPIILVPQVTGKRGEYRHAGLYEGRRIKSVAVQKLVLDHFVGPRPNGLQRAHENGRAWDNRLSNLSYKTPVENHADKAIHGTQLKGEAHPMAKLTKRKVLAIRRASGTQRSIAARYGITQTTVHHIRSGRTWADA